MRNPHSSAYVGGSPITRQPFPPDLNALCAETMAAQPLPGYLLGPVIADEKQFRQHAQRSLPAIIGR
jgi:hypothetical protein